MLPRLPNLKALHIDSFSAWDEIHDVFGDGHEYDWALAADDEVEYEEEQLKPEMKYQDVSEFRYLSYFRLLIHLKGL